MFGIGVNVATKSSMLNRNRAHRAKKNSCYFQCQMSMLGQQNHCLTTMLSESLQDPGRTLLRTYVSDYPNKYGQSADKVRTKYGQSTDKVRTYGQSTDKVRTKYGQSTDKNQSPPPQPCHGGRRPSAAPLWSLHIHAVVSNQSTAS